MATVQPTGFSTGTDVMFSRSTDSGLTFSARKRINDDPVNHAKWHWFGTLSVAPNGRIDSVWLDTRNAANNTDSQLFYSYSTDGGVNWSPNVSVSDPFNPFLGYPNQQRKIGDYITIVSDDAGGDVAYAATFNLEQDVYYVRVAPPSGAQAINLSTRMRVQTGDNAGIGGFIITGSVTKHVLIRAIGPSLTDSGVPNALADPVLELHGPGTFVTTTNNNWRDDPVQEALIKATGVPPTNDLESAIEARLAPGAYTAIVRGNGNTSGVGLVEVYDLNSGVFSRLANLSTRAFVATDDNIVIVGFVLGGSSSYGSVVLRGLGPSLAALGVPDALGNPTLELRDSNGALLVEDNDWQDDPAQAAELTAAGLAPTNQFESGLAATLPPGRYTALLAGLNNGTGVGLVEVYDVGP
jgi:hypothetical protein